MQVLTYSGWPSKEDWTKWEAWWDKGSLEISQQAARKGQKGVIQDWHLKVKRLADLIVNAFDPMVVVIVENHAQWSVEKYVWRITLIKNALLEMGILPWPIAQDNWFTRVNSLGKKLLTIFVTIKCTKRIMLHIF